MTKEKIKEAIYTRRYIYNFHYHLIWVTKYRNQTFTTEAKLMPFRTIGKLGMLFGRFTPLVFLSFIERIIAGVIKPIVNTQGKRLRC